MKVLAFIVVSAALIASGFYAGYQHAIRNNDILVMLTESNASTERTINNFSRLIKETDWCDGSKKAQSAGASQ